MESAASGFVVTRIMPRGAVSRSVSYDSKRTQGPGPPPERFWKFSCRDDALREGNEMLHAGQGLFYKGVGNKLAAASSAEQTLNGLGQDTQ